MGAQVAKTCSQTPADLRIAKTSSAQLHSHLADTAAEGAAPERKDFSQIYVWHSTRDGQLTAWAWSIYSQEGCGPIDLWQQHNFYTLSSTIIAHENFSGENQRHTS